MENNLNKTCPECGAPMSYDDFGDDECNKFCYICNDCRHVVRDY